MVGIGVVMERKYWRMRCIEEAAQRALSGRRALASRPEAVLRFVGTIRRQAAAGPELTL